MTLFLNFEAFKVKTCTYDNPETMARECWKDGRLICHYGAELFLQHEVQKIPPDKLFFGANIGPFKLGQMIGDPEAMY